MHATLRNPECDGCPLRFKEPAFDAGSCAVNVSASDPLFNAPMSEQLRRIQFRNGAQLTLIYNSPLLYYDNADLPASIRRLLGVPTLDDFDVIFHHLNYLNNYTLAPFTTQCGEELAAPTRSWAPFRPADLRARLSVSGYPGALLVDSVDERNIFYNRGAASVRGVGGAHSDGARHYVLLELPAPVHARLPLRVGVRARHVLPSVCAWARMRWRTSGSRRSGG